MTEHSSSSPSLSVVIAARNASRTLALCLESVCSQAGDDTEVIVVDDRSTDDTALVAAEFPVRLVELDAHLGVAAARNRGAALARTPLLLFLDADTVLADGALARGRSNLEDSSVDAVIGSYDDQPEARSTVSLFKNLMHHHFHQRQVRSATTFWGACGLIRRELFLAVGGFDEERYIEPSIEDVELGLRLAAAGHRIQLDPQLQVKHLKRWTIKSLITTDVRRRAVPWTLLALERRSLPDNLNLSLDQRVAAAVTVAFIATLAGGLFWPPLWALSIALLVAGLWINRRLYALFRRSAGIRLVVLGFPLLQFYYLYALYGMMVGVALYFGRRSVVVEAPDSAVEPP